MYIPKEGRDQGFADAVAEWIEDIFTRHPRREEISDDAIRYGVGALNLTGLRAKLFRWSLDWLLPERFGRFLAAVIRRIGARLADEPAYDPE